MRICWLLIALGLLLPPLPLLAETVPVGEDLTVEISVPEGWVLSREAPDFLLEEIAEHMRHDAAAQGKEVPAERIEELARKRLAANEAILFNPQSGAHLTVDFSALREGENPPSQRTVSLSAEYAGEGMKTEEGVEGATFRTEDAQVTGADYARRLVVDYRQHGGPMQFVGVIGFASPYWFFLYYTDPLKDPADLKKLDRVLESLEIQSREK